MAPSRRRPSGLTPGFTLIELLVVIAIIAILTAILLPVFASVREGSRQGVAISNMKDIQQKMEQYKLDNHKYPDVLFGYAITGANGYTDASTTLANALGKAQAYDAKNGTNQTQIAFPGLYPAYIKDPNEFTDPNNPLDANATPQVTTALSVNLVAPCNPTSDGVLNGSGSSPCFSPPPGTPAGKVVTTTRIFYKLDAYDSGPRVTAGNQVDPNTFYPRYQLAHEGTVCPKDSTPSYCDPSVNLDPSTDPQAAADYKRQLRWQNPPADTVVTMTSYHVQNADKVLLMFQSGAVKKLKAEDFQVKEGVNTFWRYPQP